MKPKEGRAKRSGRRVFRVFEGIVDWPVKLGDSLIGLSVAAWNRLTRWLAIPLAVVLVALALFFFAYSIWYWLIGYEGP